MTFGRCVRAPTRVRFDHAHPSWFPRLGRLPDPRRCHPARRPRGLHLERRAQPVWTLWPLILIGIGVGLVLSRTRFDFVGGLIVAATFGIMVGGLLSAGVSGFGGASCGSTDRDDGVPGPATARSASTGDVEVAARLRRPDGRDRPGLRLASRRQRHRRHRTDGRGRRDVARHPLEPRWRPSWLGFGDRDTWRLTLPTDAEARPRRPAQRRQRRRSTSRARRSASVGLEMNAGSATLDLGSAAAISDDRPAAERRARSASRCRTCR